MRWWWLLLMTGCSVSDNKTFAPDFSCSTEPIPTNVPSSVRVDGVILNLAGDQGIEGVTVTNIAGNIPSDPVVTDAAGRFSFTHDLPDTATEDSLEAVKPPTFLATRGYPGKPVFEDSFVELRLLPLEQLMGLATQAGVMINLEQETFALIRVTDCNESPVAGGVIDPPAIVPPPTAEQAMKIRVIYFRFQALEPAATETDASGLALIVGLPVDMDADVRSSVTITGSIGDVPIFENTVQPSLGTYVQTLARP